VVCVSEESKQRLVATWRTPPDKIVVCPNGVDVDRFRPGETERARGRAQLGLGSGPLVLFVGNFYAWHDVGTLLEAFARVLSRRPDARLVLVGDGATRSTMEARAQALGIAHAVRFTGLVSHGEVPPLLAAADVAVAPYPEPAQPLWLSPLKLFEYMAAGTAIVASATGQLVRVVEDGRNGLLVLPGDVSAMAAAIDKLIANRKLRIRLGRQARRDAEAKHSWPQYVARLEHVLRAVTARQPLPHE
jgi:glycosyltransferase involved in cell wall biosynthesis